MQKCADRSKTGVVLSKGLQTFFALKIDILLLQSWAHLWVGLLDLLLNLRSLLVCGLAHAFQFPLVIRPELTPAQHNAVLSIPVKP